MVIERTFAGLDRFERARDSRGRRHAAAILVVAVLAVLAFKLFPLQHVLLLSEGEAVHVRAVFDNQRAAFDAAALDLEPGDRLLVGRAGDHAALVVQRATPVTVLADGARVDVRTQARTVAGVLAAAGMELSQHDRVYVDGLLAAPGVYLESAATASGSVEAASTGQPVRIEVIRVQPAAMDSGRVEAPIAQDALARVIAAAIPAGRAESFVPPPAVMEVLASVLVPLPPLKTVTVVLNGQAETFSTRVERVEEALTRFGIDPLAINSLSHDPGEAVSEGMEITVVFGRETVEEAQVELIPPDVVNRSDHTLAPGEERLVEGVPGERIVRYRVTYQHGEEIERERIGSEIVRTPVTAERLIGPVAADGYSPVITDEYTGPYESRLRVWATWYDASHGSKARDHPAYGITATGIPLVHGICAVDPDVIPLGTRLYVPGYGPCLAADVGGQIKGNDIDLGFPEDHDPVPWYTGYIEIYILD